MWFQGVLCICLTRRSIALWLSHGSEHCFYAEVHRCREEMLVLRHDKYRSPFINCPTCYSQVFVFLALALRLIALPVKWPPKTAFLSANLLSQHYIRNQINLVGFVFRGRANRLWMSRDLPIFDCVVAVSLCFLDGEELWGESGATLEV